MKAPEAPEALEALKYSIKELKEAGVPEAETEAEVIFKEILGLDPASIFRDNPALTDKQKEKLKDTLLRRKKREPLQYIIGHVHFLDLKILVGPGVLIPRPETELVTLEAVKRISPLKGRPLKMVELCAGSGAISIALAKEFPEAEIMAVDISEKALEYARKNKDFNKVKNIVLLKGDLFEPVMGRKFHLIIANPPYIKDEILEILEPEVRDWEPREALAGGPEGLEIVKKIIAQASDYLLNGGFLVLEIAGRTDPEVLYALAREGGLAPEPVIKDYAGLERIFVAKRP